MCGQLKKVALFYCQPLEMTCDTVNTWQVVSNFVTIVNLSSNQFLYVNY